MKPLCSVGGCGRRLRGKRIYEKNRCEVCGSGPLCSDHGEIYSVRHDVSPGEIHYLWTFTCLACEASLRIEGRLA